MSVLTHETTRFSIEKSVADLAASVHTSAALNNEFYDRWMGGPLSFPEVSVFAEQYLHRTVNTSVMVALSVLNTRDLAARVECVKNLYSEYGNGDASKAHLVLLESFLADLLSRIKGAPVSAEDISGVPALPTTTAFSAGQRELFESDDQRTVLGALLAQEHLAYSMLTRLYEGVRNYKSVYATDDDFHEACEYFYVHIGEAEKDHKAQAVASATAVCRDEDDLAVVEKGFRGFVDLTAAYWAGVAAEMTRRRTA
ncbi:iron-containing redox enzyme family protein [Streptomyces roseoverticillatus]|uniref:iron-containing redox enzyme family protein n=1 Tax=Streptomyces roseoverticillatus TaxID=66429 RepID=UPI001F3BC828|nr:iron-containing redox enzyme family protein [Streptomyces roseoverticillatus]MCF3106544.1 iron-containing redox enzyme family protein [Streptomyces roseoverticillatus]